MKERRWPWLISAGLMLAGAVALGISTYLSWLPCRSSILAGTWMEGLGISTADASPACIELTDSYGSFGAPGNGVPGATEAGMIGLALLGLAWVPVVLIALRSWSWRLLALTPSFIGWTLTGLGLAGVHPYDAFWSAQDLLALGAVIVVLAQSPHGWSRRNRLRTVMIGWAAGSAGLFHFAIDFMLMSGLSQGYWDVPPGLGYPTVAGTMASALMIMLITWWSRSSGSSVPTPERRLVETVS